MQPSKIHGIMANIQKFTPEQRIRNSRKLFIEIGMKAYIEFKNSEKEKGIKFVQWCEDEIEKLEDIRGS